MKKHSETPSIRGDTNVECNTNIQSFLSVPFLEASNFLFLPKVDNHKNGRFITRGYRNKIS